MKKLSLGLLGSAGRMGAQVRQLLEGPYSDRIQLNFAAVRGGALGDLLQTDVVLDFSTPQAMMELSRQALMSQHPLPIFVVGSTGPGLDLTALAQKATVFCAPNFSLGIAWLNRVLKSQAGILRRIGYEVTLQEIHHKHKVDSPSGTALHLSQALGGELRQPIQSLRAGEVIGIHTTRFLGSADELEITHRATDRSVFARGALDVCLWLQACRMSRTALPNRILAMEDFLDRH